jgi:protein phosphatase
MNIIRRIFGQTPDDITSAAQDSITNEQPEDPTPNDTQQEIILASDAESDDEDTGEYEATGIYIEQPRPTITQQLGAHAYGFASNVGMMRKNNQDACFALQLNSITATPYSNLGLFVVADGMGGHYDGEKASALAIQTLSTEMLEHVYIPLLNDFENTPPDIINELVKATEKANTAVIEHISDGGTTLTAVALVGDIAYLAHIGDSRAYLIKDDSINQLTRDHSLVQRLIELEKIRPEEAEYHPQKNVLYRAIGQNKDIKIETLIRPLPTNAMLLLCSDGLWGLVDDEAIRHIVSLAQTPQEACENLVARANANGGTDNITAVIIQTSAH